MRPGRLLAALTALAAVALLLTVIMPAAPQESPRLATFSLETIEPAIAVLPFKGEDFAQAPRQPPPGIPPRSQFNPRFGGPGFGLDRPRGEPAPGAECFRPGLDEPCVPICAEPAGAGGAPLPLCAERRPEGRPPTERG
ncbi:MAG: hypothetical protein MSC31_12230 [Solirubrobacteraceae bacterium MAG38_C4-C5]|nr:hypothetical protein [Candidatus Siliceabacter maunaloa]